MRESCSFGRAASVSFWLAGRQLAALSGKKRGHRGRQAPPPVWLGARTLSWRPKINHSEAFFSSEVTALDFDLRVGNSGLLAGAPERFLHLTLKPSVLPVTDVVVG